MADAKGVEIAKAIVAQLAAASYSQTIEVERSYLPQFDRETLTKTVKVVVMNKSHDETPMNRAELRLDVSVDIGVMSALDVCDVARGDALMQLVDEIKADLAGQQQAEAAWMRTVELRDENELPYILAEANRTNTLVAAFRCHYLQTRDFEAAL